VFVLVRTVSVVLHVIAAFAVGSYACNVLPC